MGATASKDGEPALSWPSNISSTPTEIVERDTPAVTRYKAAAPGLGRRRHVPRRPRRRRSALVNRHPTPLPSCSSPSASALPRPAWAAASRARRAGADRRRGRRLAPPHVLSPGTRSSCALPAAAASARGAAQRRLGPRLATTATCRWPEPVSAFVRPWFNAPTELTIAPPARPSCFCCPAPRWRPRSEAADFPSQPDQDRRSLPARRLDRHLARLLGEKLGERVGEPSGGEQGRRQRRHRRAAAASPAPAGHIGLPGHVDRAAVNPAPEQGPAVRRPARLRAVRWQPCCPAWWRHNDVR